jgi:galactitol-specific phosphotransferase system IIC component
MRGSVPTLPNTPLWRGAQNRDIIIIIIIIIIVNKRKLLFNFNNQLEVASFQLWQCHSGGSLLLLGTLKAERRNQHMIC